MTLKRRESSALEVTPLITPRALFDTYLRSIELGGARACEDWSSPQAWATHALRALVATRALIIAADPIVATMGAGVYLPNHLSIGTESEWGRTGHFGLDVTLTDPRNAWAPPLFIAEHERAASADAVQYAAWRLHSIKASRRMLVASFGCSTSIATFEHLKALVGEVGAVQGQEMLLIGSDLDATPGSVAELVAAHQTSVVSSPA